MFQFSELPESRSIAAGRLLDRTNPDQLLCLQFAAGSDRPVLCLLAGYAAPAVEDASQGLGWDADGFSGSARAALPDDVCLQVVSWVHRFSISVAYTRTIRSADR